MTRKRRAPHSEKEARRNRKAPKKEVSTIAQHHRRNSKDTLWLDLLPEDLSRRIATHVMHGHPNLDGLHLAESSAHQARAIRQALSHHVVFDTESFMEYGIRWTNVFENETRSVRFKGMLITYARSLLGGRYHLRLLKAPCLLRAEIFDCVNEFKAVYRSQSIQELCVRIRRSSSHKLLLETLASIADLRKLKVLCFVEDTEPCTHGQVNSLHGAIASSCVNLSSLQLSCAFYNRCYRSEGQEDFDFWRHLPAFTKLRELHVERHIPEEVVPAVAKLDSVIIRYAPNAIHLAQKIGNPVTTLCISETLGLNDVASIAHFHRLKELVLYISPGAEAPLLDVARSAYGLRSLTLEWTNATSRKCTARPVKHLWTLNQYCDAPVGFILEVVQALADLRQLELYGVRLQLKELLEVLKHMGTQLQKFGIPFDDQDEAPHDRLESILTTMILHNRSLQWLYFEADFNLVHCTDHHKRLSRQKDAWKLERQSDRIAALLGRLQLSAPELKPSFTHNVHGCFLYKPDPCDPFPK